MVLGSIFSIAREGDHARINGRTYVVERHIEEDNSVLLTPTNGGKPQLLTQERLAHLWATGQAETLPPNWEQLPRHTRQSLRKSIVGLTPEQRHEMSRKLRYCRAIEQHLLPGFRKSAHVAECVEQVAKARGDIPPSVRQAKAWMRLYDAADGDPRVLIAGNHAKGNRKPRMDSFVYLAMAKACQSLLTLDKRNVNTAYSLLHDYLKKRFGDEGATAYLPSLRTFYRYWRAFSPEAKLYFREGKRAHRRKTSPLQTGPVVSRPLQRVEMDWTKTGILVVDPVSGVVLGSPWLIVAFDCYTRTIPGFHLSFEPPSWASASQCFKHMVSPKAKFIADINANLEPGCTPIRQSWPIHGVPTKLVVDCDATWGSTSMRATCFDLGCTVEQLPPYAPQLKGMIERFNRTITDGLFDYLPGQKLKTKQHYDNEYDPNKTAAITINMLRYLVTKWICDVYHVSKHRGIDSATPLQMLKQASETYQLPRIPPHSALVELTGEAVTRSIGERGIIRLHGMYYSSQELLRHALTLKAGEEVLVRYDPENIELIHVIDRKTGNVITGRCTGRVMQEFTHGLSKHALRVIRRHAIMRRENKDQGHLELKELLEAKRDLIVIADQLLKRRRSRGMHAKLARFMEGFDQVCGIPAIDEETFSDPAEDMIDVAAEVRPSRPNVDGPPMYPEHWEAPAPQYSTSDRAGGPSVPADFGSEDAIPSLEVD